MLSRRGLARLMTTALAARVIVPGVSTATSANQTAHPTGSQQATK